MAPIHKPGKRELLYLYSSESSFMTKNVGLSSFIGITGHMGILLHGQTGTFMRIGCEIMGIHTSHTTWFSPTSYQRRASLSYSMVSRVMSNMQSGRRHTSTLSRHRSSVITA